MKLYSSKSNASTQMIADDQLREELSRILSANHDISVFESGTYLGQGSTRMMADLFLQQKQIPKTFITVETHPDYYSKATRNLAGYKFITPVFGLSVDFFEAVKFLVTDEIFLNLSNYPNVYIDHAEQPQQAYLREIMIGFYRREIVRKKTWFRRWRRQGLPPFQNNVLQTFAQAQTEGISLIVLDSAAGIGFFEFQKAMEFFDRKPYYLLLDDIDHLKHFRSRRYIETHQDQFELLAFNENSGWLLAKSRYA